MLEKVILPEVMPELSWMNLAENRIRGLEMAGMKMGKLKCCNLGKGKGNI